MKKKSHKKIKELVKENVYSELQNFKKELIIDLKIENEVLFPKALSLEKDFCRYFRILLN